MTLRLAFMGTPDFAVPSLAALVASGHDIAAVYTQPSRPAGRGQKPQISAVQRFAEREGLSVRAPKSLKSPDAQTEFAALGLDLAVVAAYGLILPAPILAAPRLGCVNVHASLLPRWRGAAPIARAIMAGDEETGVTIMQMDEGLDTGPMLLAERLAIGRRMSAGALHDQLAQRGADLLIRAIAALERGTLSAVPQPQEGATYAKKIDKAETRLDWTQSAVQLERQVRGLSPNPGAWTEAHGERVKILDAESADGQGAPGLVLAENLTIACGTGALRLLRLQRAGRAPMNATEFLRGFPLAPGASFV